ncbi:MAG: exodeoxyribonuclease VII large subunit [Geminicoccaceae bacterium]
MATTADNLQEYSVSELSSALKRNIEDAFGFVRVRGEISGLKLAASGHLYLSLKDENAVMDAVCWRGSRRNITFKPEDGLEVVCTGKLTTYPARSRYQLVVETMAPAGGGALMALLEERKQKLRAEGLFEASRKRQIPEIPTIIGIVTSPTGAVIRDMLHRIAERFPRDVLLWPVLVQGEGAAAQIAAAIDGFNKLEVGGDPPRPDVLIVARGGGSLEDLWSFNEEIVVRATARSAIPLISAVGHETDTTLIDFASDLRAPTPTAAAELAVPVRLDLMARTQQLDGAMRQALVRHLRLAGEQFRSAGRGLSDPKAIVQAKAQRLDDVGERLSRAIYLRYEQKRGALAGVAARLLTPRQLLQRNRLRLDQAGRALEERIRNRMRWSREAGRNLTRRWSPALLRPLLKSCRERVTGLGQVIEATSYKRTLERGYAVVRDPAGEVIATAEALKAAGRGTVQLRDASVGIAVADRPGAEKPAKPASKDLPKDAEQGRLL